MPIVTVKLLEGRSREQKTALMQQVAAAVVNSLGVAPPAVRVLLEEVSPEHWSVGGVSKADSGSTDASAHQTGDVP